jgi:hypothetical protein
METKEMQSKVVDLLKENEVAMRDMYLEFSKSYVVYESFWKGIATEEESHAAWINTLYYKMNAGLVEFAQSRFPLEAIKNNINYMKGMTAKAQEKKLSLLEALEAAVHMEHGMLENKFFEVFKDDSMELQIVLEALRLGTREHYREVKRVWEKEKMGADFEKAKI